MFNLSQQLKTLKDDLSNSGGAQHTIKVVVDEKLPKEFNSHPNQLFPALKNIASLVLGELENGVLQLDFHLKGRNEKKIVMGVRILGSGVNEARKNIQFVVEEYFESNDYKDFQDVSIRQEGNQFIVNFSIPMEMDEKNESHNLFAFSGKKVLIVEDSEINTFVFASVLESWGVQYTIVYEGLAAVNYALSREYDGIFMDIMLPVMNGVEAIKIIRKENKEIPIIVISGVRNLSDIEDAIAAGANDFIRKPITNKEIFNVLSKHFVVYEKVQK